MAGRKLNNANLNMEDTGINSGAVYENIERGKDRKGKQAAASAEEQKERNANLKTRGRLGCKSDRLSVSFSNDNYNFIKIMSGVMGLSVAEFVNMVLDRYRAENASDYREAIELYDRLSNSDFAKGKK